MRRDERDESREETTEDGSGEWVSRRERWEGYEHGDGAIPCLPTFISCIKNHLVAKRYCTALTTQSQLHVKMFLLLDMFTECCRCLSTHSQRADPVIAVAQLQMHDLAS